MLKEVVKSVPVVGQVVGLTQTAMKVYQCTSPVQALKTAVLSIVDNCAPPVVKYPLKCGILLAQVGLVISSGGSSSWGIALILATARQIIED